MRPVAAAVRGRYDRADVPTLVLNFFGLFGPQGALPLPYTRTLCELDTDRTVRKTSARTALRDWLDLFNNRLAALLYRAWQKYRLPVGYVRSVWRTDPAADRRPPDKLTQVLFSVVGLGVPGLRDRLKVEDPAGRPLARIDDLALLHYAGAFARRRPGERELEAILADYFALPTRVVALTGQWLSLPPASQTRLAEGANAVLGLNAVAGEQIWDVNSKFRLRLGPLRYKEFVDFLPDPTPVPDRKGVFLLSQLTRLYVGPEFDFEVQLVLYKFEVPDCVIQEVDEGQLGIRLGWNTWLAGDDMPDEVDDVLFDAPGEVTLPVTFA
jgi:type VI secretion system protein ImpH